MSDLAKLIFALVIIAGAALAFWLLGGGDDAAPELERGEVREQAGERNAAAPRREIAPRPQAPEADAVDSKPADDTDAEVESPAEDGPGLLVRGRIRIVDLENRELPIEQQSGIVELGAGRKKGSSHHDAELRNGRFEVIVPDRETITFIGPSDGVRDVGTEKRHAKEIGFPAPPRADQFLPLPDGTAPEIAEKADRFVQIDMTMRLVPRVRLHVTDAVSRAPLSNVRVILPSNSYSDVPHPGDLSTARLIVQGDSPLTIDLKQSGDNTNYRVQAKDHALGTISFDKSSEGERFLPLDPGGSLKIVVRGSLEEVQDDFELHLRVRDRNPKTDLDRGPNQGIVTNMEWGRRSEFVMENVPVGRYEISLETGTRFQPEFLVAKATTEVVAGSSGRVELVPDVGPLTRPLAAVSGKVIRAENRREAWPHLYFQIRTTDPKSQRLTPRKGVSSVRRIEEGEAEIPFGPVKLAPGRYVAQIGEQRFEFDVPAAGRDDLVFQLEAKKLIELVLRWKDGEEIAEGANVTWMGNGSNGSAIYDEKRRAFLMAPPNGALSLHLWISGSFHTRDLTIADSTSRLEVEIEKGQAFKLLLKCGDVIIPHDFDLDITIVDENQRRVFIRSSSSSGDGITRNLDRPGRFTVTLGTPPKGYRALGPVSFEVKPGETKEVALELARE